MMQIDSTLRLKSLRLEMNKIGIDAFILPMEDNHYSEYTSFADKRIAFISGFTGTAGTAVISMNSAALWTDGRYHNQASNELDNNWILFREGTPDVTTITQWLVQSTHPTARIGFDPQQLPFISVESYIRDLDLAEKASWLSNTPSPINPNSEVVAYRQKRLIIPVPGTNMVDIVWESMRQSKNELRPSRPRNPVDAVPIAFAGVTWQEKLDEVRSRLKKVNSSATILSSLDEIAWLLNLRGSDIAHNPLFFAYAVVTSQKLILFVDTARGPESVDFAEYLLCPTHPSEILSYSEFPSWLDSFQKQNLLASERIWLSPTSSYAIVASVPREFRHIDISPIASMKSVKNSTELAGMRTANLVDSLALCEFLAWLEDVFSNNSTDGTSHPFACVPCDCETLPPKILNEATVSNYLDAIRTSTEGCLGLSFSTISAVDADAAIVHYHTTDTEKSPKLTRNSVYLVDSGGQYSTGTTDVTRTVHLGTPALTVVEDYTLVLKAHINLATQLFPDNTAGTKLDVVCRSILWRFRRDFLHGTGHGVGAHLCVHEGPIGLSGRRSQELASLGIMEPGLRKDMVVTIEPGYYLPGQYGIRLENVNVVIQSSDETTDPALFLAFQPLTLVPFQRKLINVDLLSKEEVTWLDRYHNRVRTELLKLILHDCNEIADKLTPSKRRTRAWILRETAPIMSVDD